jgi:hypothetical protein
MARPASISEGQGPCGELGPGITRWVLARLRHHSFQTVAEVDAAIAQLLPSVNDRPFQKLVGSRASVFAELDAPALAPFALAALRDGPLQNGQGPY